MAFEPLNGLEQALMEAANDPAARIDFYNILVNSKLIFIHHGADVEQVQQKTMQAGSQVQIQNVQYKGKAWIPVFTSLPRLKAVLKKEVVYVELSALGLMETTKGANLLINPGSEVGKEMTKEEVAMVLDGSIFRGPQTRELKIPTQIMIRETDDVPSELSNALKRYFDRQGSVERAYFAEYQSPETDNELHLLCGVESTGEWRHISAGAFLTANAVSTDRGPLEFVEITEKDGLDHYFRERCKPFYEREVGE